ncbi:MAG: hypothetical protein GY870_14990 [archaeon]|nr:hypothetical protein [archaeon]
MSHGGFLIDNQIATAESIAINKQPAIGYDINVVKNEIVSEVFKTAVADTIALEIDITLPEAIPITAGAVIAHKFSEANGSIIIGFYASGFGGIITESVHLTPNIIDRYLYRKNYPGTLEKVLENTTYKTFTLSQNYKYIRFVVGYSVAEINQLACLFLGTKFQFPTDFMNKFTKTFDVGMYKNFLNGQAIEEQVTEQEGFSLEFAESRGDNFNEYKHLYRQGHKIFVPDFDEKPCYFGTLTNNPFSVNRIAKTSETVTLDSFRLDFVESF